MSAAIQLAFLMDGFNSCHKWEFGHAQVSGEDYQYHSDKLGGYIGIVTSMEQYAEVVHEMAVQASTNRGYPGVFEYEVTEGLGQWLFYHPEHFNDTFVPLTFSTHARHLIESWFSPNQPPVAEATSPESTTMTVEQLIAKLHALDNPYLEILTRGSEAQKMVDAIEVRVVKTKTRTAVFIGKPKAVTAD